MNHYDVLVIGAGPAGLAAALAAAQHTPALRVGMVDDQPQPGGQIWRGGPARQREQRAQRLWRALLAAPNVSVLTQTQVLYAPQPGQLRVQTPHSAATLSYARLILATGARERLLPFPGWTLPGVTGAGGLQALAKGGYPVQGKRVVLAGSGPLLLAAAASLRASGAQLVAIIEQAPLATLAGFGLGLLATPSKLAQALHLARQLRGVRYLCHSHVQSAHADEHGVLQMIVVQRAGAATTQTLACDYLACGFGLLPNVELAQALGCVTVAADGQTAVQVDQQQLSSVPGIYCAGESTGIGGVELALAEGRIAGLAATGQPVTPALYANRARWKHFAARLARAFAVRPPLLALANDDTIVCRCEDVCHGALRVHTTWRSAKLQTRCGMGACQGRVCGGATELLYGWRPDAVQTPISPARLASLIDSP